MSIIRGAVKSTLNALLGVESAQNLIVGCYDFRSLLSCSSRPLYWQSKRGLRAFKDKHAGQRCFIIGNGPSLNKMDLSLLRDEVTFGLNRIYLLFDRMGFDTTYYVSVNPYVIEQSAQEIDGIEGPKFIGWAGRKFLRPGKDTFFLRARSGLDFSTDITRGIWEGATVTYVAMQISYYMGFREVVLIGVDHNFVTKGEPNKVVVSEREDPNHFDPNYFGRGFKWQLPDLEVSEAAYGVAKEVYLRSGRRILDATEGGKLTVFPKAGFESTLRRPSNG